MSQKSDVYFLIN